MMAGASDFIDQYLPIVSGVAQKYNLDPRQLLSQIALETGFGKHVIPGSNNPGNIKQFGGGGVSAVDNQTGTTDNYHAYPTLEAGVDAMGSLLARKYAGGTNLTGYAEDPNYQAKLQKVGAQLDAAAPGPLDPSTIKWDDAAAPAQNAAPQPGQIKWDDEGSAAPVKAAPAAPKATPRQQLADNLTNNWLDQVTQGALHSVTNTIGGVAQKGAHAIGDVVSNLGGTNAGPAINHIGDAIASYLSQGTPNTPAGIAGQVLGGSVLPVPAATGITRAALQGATLGAAQPVQNPDQNFWSQTGKQALIGAAAGGAGGAAGRLISGFQPTAAAQAVNDLGVTPTVGQALGGTAKSVEERLNSLPIVGDAMKVGQRQQVDQFNRALYNRALAPLGQSVPDGVATGADAVTHVRDTIGQAFDNLEQNASFQPRGQFIRDLQNVRTDLAQNAPERLAQFDTVVNNNIAQKLQNGSLTGPQWGDARSTINTLARNARMGNSTPADRAFASSMDDLNDAMTQQVIRNSPPGLAQQLQQASTAWRGYKQIESAAGMQGAVNRNNIFTPAQFSNAVRNSSTNYQRATNSGMNGQIAQQAQEVLGNHYPDSGTTGRYLTDAAIMGGAAHFSPLAALGAAATIPAYGTNIGRQAVYNALFNRPDVLQQLGPLLQGLSGNAGIPAANQ